MHDKVFVVDGRTVITGSFNWTRQAQAANDENAVFIDNDWLAQRYADEFARIYAQAVHPMRCGN
jgi:phosphatidylserine/phosphatidylglycerophosphate/cardiolipin synthase-like enzyme